MAVRHNPRCGICGAPTRLKDIRGVPSLSCVSCGAVTVDQSGLDQLVGGGTPAGPEPAPLSAHVPRRTPGPVPRRRSEMEIRTAPPSRSEPSYSAEGLAVLSEAQFELALERKQAARTRLFSVIVGLVTCLLVVVVAVPLSFAVYQAVRSWRHPVVPTEPAISLGDALPAPVPEPAPDVAPTVQPEPDVPEAPAPGSAPPPSPRSRARALIGQGWSLVNRDPAEAASRFQDALALDPGSADASYGVGYALLKQGNPSDAQPWLCTALRTGDLEVKRDVQSLLDSNTLTCP